MDDDDDMPRLPADTLQMLQKFHQEKDDRNQQFEDLKSQAETRFQHGNDKLSMDHFGEDWNASQFWYTDETARILAKQLLNDVNEGTAIAVVSAPSVYVQLHNVLVEVESAIRPQICLLEYDKRFEVVGSDFVFYDFQHPLRLPPELKGRFDRIICDPPFLSEDCQTKTALTVRFLARDWAAPHNSNTGLRLISCTGERMEPIITKLYGSLNMGTTTFEPEHTRGLSNEFRCYANFECADWQYRQTPSGDR
jgi:hypothetical protein